jgi:hypothetical protein
MNYWIALVQKNESFKIQLQRLLNFRRTANVKNKLPIFLALSCLAKNSAIIFLNKN